MGKTLETFAKDKGWEVRYRKLRGAQGWCMPSQRVILVDSRLGYGDKIATLLHEIGHALMVDLPYLQDDTSREFFASLFSLTLAGVFRGEALSEIRHLRRLGFYERPDNEKQYILSEVNKAVEVTLGWFGFDQVYALTA